MTILEILTNFTDDQWAALADTPYDSVAATNEAVRERVYETVRTKGRAAVQRWNKARQDARELAWNHFDPDAQEDPTAAKSAAWPAVWRASWAAEADAVKALIDPADHEALTASVTTLTTPATPTAPTKGETPAA